MAAEPVPPGPGPERIAFDGVGMTYRAASGPVEALREISFTVGQGQLVALVGPSGCGKSTLLRIVAGLRPASAGRVVVDGQPVTGPLPSVGMVFQAPVLLRWRRLLDNVLLPADLAGRRRDAYLGRADDLLRMTGLVEFANKYPAELSGGMQQRAALCRALLLDPAILLMDEPFGALDAMTRDEMGLELLRVWGEGAGPADDRKTVLFVTHSIPEAVKIGNRVLLLSPHPGQVRAELNSDGTDAVDPATSMRLSERIDQLLFANEAHDPARDAGNVANEVVNG